MNVFILPGAKAKELVSQNSKHFLLFGLLLMMHER